jgi:hypothetical protein
VVYEIALENEKDEIEVQFDPDGKFPGQEKVKKEPCSRPLMGRLWTTRRCGADPAGVVIFTRLGTL